MNGCAWENETERADFYMEEYLASKNKIERIERERDRFKARAEALESEVLARGCITCKHRGTRSLTVPCVRCNMASEWEWRGPQEGANT